MKTSMYNIKFKYADELSGWRWSSQQCLLYASSNAEAIMKCKKLYGLGIDCEYQIIEVKEVSK